AEVALVGTGALADAGDVAVVEPGGSAGLVEEVVAHGEAHVLAEGAPQREQRRVPLALVVDALRVGGHRRREPEAAADRQPLESEVAVAGEAVPAERVVEARERALAGERALP